MDDVVTSIVRALPVLILTVLINETYKGLLAGLTPARTEYMTLTEWLTAHPAPDESDDPADGNRNALILARKKLVARRDTLAGRIGAETHITKEFIWPLLGMVLGVFAISGSAFTGDNFTAQAVLYFGGAAIGLAGAVRGFVVGRR
ncbi:hypothetical protein [Clavibacter michiganensis]|uniref:hypothetical protein n=1 Tax=Clavibacter michiganensis TaxID=28447 RepID=UPI00292E453D|nr:hypothetical protein [Clavibacter michiganensis]